MTCQRYLLWIVYKCIVEGGTIYMSCQSNFGWTVYEFKSKDEPSYIHNWFSCGPHNMYFYLEIISNTFLSFSVFSYSVKNFPITIMWMRRQYCIWTTLTCLRCCKLSSTLIFHFLRTNNSVNSDQLRSLCFSIILLVRICV